MGISILMGISLVDDWSTRRGELTVSRNRSRPPEAVNATQ